MRAVCLIPVYDRAELLAHVLRCIEKADGTGDILFLFKPDQGNPHPTRAQKIAMGECLEVMGTFKLNFQVIPYGQPPRIPAMMRQSWNVLTGYGIAARIAGEGGLVYMVESDVIVGKDFFSWHVYAHQRGQKGHEMERHPIFCSVASEDTNTPVDIRPTKPTQQEKAYANYDGAYRSIGVCWKAEQLRDLIGPHVKDAYFLQPQQYIKSFPVNPWGTTWCEQDGLIRRIQVNQPLPISYAYVPVCYHAGYYGGNRGNARNAPKGTLHQRIDQVGEVIYSREAMRVKAPSEAYYRDSVPIEGITNPCLALTT